MNKKPNFFVVGTPKSGTTALYFLLKQHPEVFLPIVKEPRFFSTDFQKEEDEFYKKNKGILRTNKYLYRTKKAYLELFKDVKGQVAIGEVTPEYLYSKEAAKNIHKFNKNAKIILILREPVDFSYSSYTQRQGSGEGTSNFKEALELEPMRKKGIYKKITSPPLSQSFYSEEIKYYKQISRFLKLFGKNKIKVLIFEDFVKDNIKYAKAVYKFLGIDDKFNPSTKKVNTGKSLKYKNIKLFFDKPFMLNLRRGLKKLLPKKIILKLNNLFTYLLYKKGKDKLPIGEINFYKKRFKKDVEKTQKFLHKNNFLDKNKSLIKLWGYDNIN